ncbi:hypothetical protein A9Q79_02335 [Methylophaga sp. 42_25_T18]|nr:hypothetical protein A9Q79_02335 [Methylophaga sp. 42_25_T18]
MEKVPFYKKKWFVGTKVQRDLVIYIICMCLLSQLLVISSDLTEENLIIEPYAQYFTVLIQITFYGCIIYGLRLTNCIAGPLSRLKIHMDEVAAGKTDSELHFRKSDYNLDLAESFNAVLRNRVHKNNEDSSS